MSEHASGPDQWIRPAGTSTENGFTVAIRPDGNTWNHTGLLIVDLEDGKSRTIATQSDEYAIVPLSGGGDLDVVAGDFSARLTGRTSVFAGVADVAYIPRRSEVTVTARGKIKAALCFARAKADISASVVRADDVPNELRGAGRCSRQVRNFGTPGVLNASSLIACEILTPSANWSSYPPHKHDESRPGVEAELEEIYYFEIEPIAGAPENADAIGFCCVYGENDRPIDVKAQVRTGDVVLVPHGWHGPAMAVPGYNMYYLNVMAGPGAERSWLICDDPAHGWIRQTWESEPTDARLPF